MYFPYYGIVLLNMSRNRYFILLYFLLFLLLFFTETHYFLVSSNKINLSKTQIEEALELQISLIYSSTLDTLVDFSRTIIWYLVVQGGWGKK